MGNDTPAPTPTLLADLGAKREWVRLHPIGVMAQAEKRKIREIEHELANRGIAIEAAAVAARVRRLGYVAFWPDRPGQPRESKVVHFDRDCQHIRFDDKYVRQATDDELAALPPCGTCG